MKLASVAFLGATLTFIRMMAGFLVSKFVAVYAGPVGMAMLGQLQSFIGILNGLVVNQLAQGVVRYSAENQRLGLVACAEWWKAAVSIVVLIVSTIVPVTLIFNASLSTWLFDNDEYGWVIVTACLVLPLSAANSFSLSVLNGFGDNKKNITTSMISIIVTLVVTTLALYLYGVIGGLVVVSITSAISGVIVLIRVKNEPWFKAKYWYGKVDYNKRKKLMGYVLVGIIGAITGPTSVIFVRNIIVDVYSMGDAGIWQSTVRISDAYVSICTLGVGMYFFPKAASINNDSELKSITYKVLLLLIPVSFVGLLTIYLFRDFIINILFTSVFLEATELLKSRLIGDFFRIAAFIPASILLAKGYFKTNIAAEVLMNVSLVIGSSVLIDDMGLKTVNYVYTFNYILYFFFSVAFFNYHCKKLRQV
ncbi:conserved membrane hypothetical protein [Vibrio chagasii]|nr:conserved membrane hypothetical protein [Vibrio chagasii]